MKYLKSFILDYILFNLFLSIVMCVGIVFSGYNYLGMYVLGLFLVVVLICLRYFFDKKLSIETYRVNVFVTAIVLISFSVFFYFSNGYIASRNMRLFYSVIFPFFPISLIFSLMQIYLEMFLCIGIIILLELVLSAYKLKQINFKNSLKFIAGCLVVGIFNYYLYLNSPQLKYKGHSFPYMHGYSSTDFTDYMVYSENSKLVVLDHESSLLIEDEKDMPVLDGAEACFPLYSSIAKAIYKDIDVIEMNNKNDFSYQNGKIVTFTNSRDGYYRLIEGEVDIFFGAKPSLEQMEYAEYVGVEIELIEIGKEAFVFFVDSNNPVDDLKAEEIKAIYHGDITNWKNVGGKNEEILAFQRPENSGSQVMMRYFMGDIELKKPVGYELVGSMGEIIDVVAEYNGEKGAIGYSFRYFLTGLHEEKEVKIISVDGIYPSNENIINNSYPATGSLYAAIIKGNKKSDKVIEFIWSDDGQELVEKSGYIPIR